jgi:hypothetical protein
MSAAALQSLASAAAATIYDAIGAAETGAELDDLVKLVWRGNLDGAIDDVDAMRLVQYVEQRRPLHRHPHRQWTFPGIPIPAPNLRRVTSTRQRSRFPRRREQRSPDKRASYERRHRLAYSGGLPRHLAPGLTVADMAVMRIVADEYVRSAGCELSLAEIAARAGGCRKTAKRALLKARTQRLISIEERPVLGQRNKPNLIRIISFEWLKWLRRSKEKNEPKQVAGGGGHFVPPTDTTTTDDGGDDVVEFKKAEPPPETDRPESGQPTKEAMAFADELATLAGYKPATTPDSWRNANPPQVVQVWLNELGKYELYLRQRPVDLVRNIAKHVMARKQVQDPSPPYSPRYFGVEIYRVIRELERTRQEILKMRRTA